MFDNIYIYVLFLYVSFQCKIDIVDSIDILTSNCPDTDIIILCVWPLVPLLSNRGIESMTSIIATECSIRIASHKVTLILPFILTPVGMTVVCARLSLNNIFS